jgi:hypothetical protein
MDKAVRSAQPSAPTNSAWILQDLGFNAQDYKRALGWFPCV